MTFLTGQCDWCLQEAEWTGIGIADQAVCTKCLVWQYTCELIPMNEGLQKRLV